MSEIFPGGKWLRWRVLAACLVGATLIGGQLLCSKLSRRAEQGLRTLYTVRASWNYAFVDSVKDLILYNNANDEVYLLRMQQSIAAMEGQQRAWDALMRGEEAPETSLMQASYGGISREQRNALIDSVRRARKIPFGPQIDAHAYRMDDDLSALRKLADETSHTPLDKRARFNLAIYELTNNFTRRNIINMMRTGAVIQMQIGLFGRLYTFCWMGLLMMAAALLTLLGRRMLKQEHDLAGSQEELAMIAQATNDAIWEYDAVRKRIWINDQFAELIGVPDRAHVQTQDIWSRVHPDERLETLRDYRSSILRQERLWLRDVRMLRFDGRYATLAVRARVIYDGRGRCVRVLGGMRDISLRRAVERRQQLLFDRNVNGIIRANLDGEVTECNEALCHLLGYPDWETMRAEPLPKIYVRPEQKTQIVEDLRAGRDVKHRELQVYCRDGSIKSILASLIVVPDPESGQTGIECFVQDVTALRQLQEELVQSQKMEAVGRLAGGVAHDFNNLLMVMGSYAQMMTRTNDEAKRQRYASQMMETTKRGAALTGQLLSFSRRQALQAVTLDVNESLRRLAELLPRVLGEDIALELRLASGQLPTRIDPTSLDQVIMNLAVNARDAMPRGGRLTIETDRDDLGPEPNLRISVADTGEGMTPEVQTRIFEPFYTSKPVGKGTGLGLSTVYGIVRQNDGVIEVESKPGAGACFRIHLPLRNEPVAGPTRADDKSEAKLPPLSVLLAEDETEVRETIAEHLRAAGCRVACAGNAAEAMRLFAIPDVEYDLLLTDVIMPGLNGRELAEQLRRKRPQLRVLYMSGYTDGVLQRDQLGDNYLQKPFSLATLSERISHLFNTPSQ